MDISCSLNGIASSVYDAVAYVPRVASQKFENITDAVFSKNVSQVAKNAFYAAPYTAASFLIPLPVQVALAVGYVAARILFGDVPSKETRFSLHTGFGNSALIRTAISTVNFLKTREPVFLITSVIGLLSASLWHNTAADLARRA